MLLKLTLVPFTTKALVDGQWDSPLSLSHYNLSTTKISIWPTFGDFRLPGHLAFPFPSFPGRRPCCWSSGPSPSTPPSPSSSLPPRNPKNWEKFFARKILTFCHKITLNGFLEKFKHLKRHCCLVVLAEGTVGTLVGVLDMYLSDTGSNPIPRAGWLLQTCDVVQ